MEDDESKEDLVQERVYARLEQLKSAEACVAAIVQNFSRAPNILPQKVDSHQSPKNRITNFVNLLIILQLYSFQRKECKANL